MTTFDTEVLIAGAGPTGLTLALWLKRLGVQVRIIDKRAGSGETSRALAVQARTLEFHRQIGIVDDVLAAGVRIDRLGLRTTAGLVAAPDLGSFGEGVTAFPYAFALPQDVHEKILVEHLEKAGVIVERRTELAGFAQDATGVTASLRKDGLNSVVRAAYLVGADGAHSTVRHGLDIGFPGGVYQQSFYVADVMARGAVTHGGMDVTLGSYGFAIAMPVRQNGSLRLIGIVPRKHEARIESLTFEDIRAEVERDAGVRVDSVNWFSAYHVHHRVAEKFRVGRAFLAGDASHIHSPAGGQGMNTGIGDAVNLAWKLAAVLHGRAHAGLLDSYEAERRAFAKVLIEGTDRGFRLLTSHSRLSGLWRRYVMPRIMAMVLGSRAGSRAFFRIVSQTGITYRDGPISEGHAARLKGGDRLPYVATRDGDNFAPLASLDWQVHVWGRPTPIFRAAIERMGIALHEFDWSAAADAAGLVRGAAYLVRPDGYVGLVAAQDHALFERYVRDLGVRTRPAAEDSARGEFSARLRGLRAA